jgi:hypothetical protein
MLIKDRVEEVNCMQKKRLCSERMNKSKNCTEEEEEERQLKELKSGNDG